MWYEAYQKMCVVYNRVLLIQVLVLMSVFHAFVCIHGNLMLVTLKHLVALWVRLEKNIQESICKKHGINNAAQKNSCNIGVKLIYYKALKFTGIHVNAYEKYSLYLKRSIFLNTCFFKNITSNSSQVDGSLQGEKPRKLTTRCKRAHNIQPSTSYLFSWLIFNMESNWDDAPLALRLHLNLASLHTDGYNGTKGFSCSGFLVVKFHWKSEADCFDFYLP